MDERLGKLHFWMTFFGFHLTFLVQHWLGAEGMPRRYADYLPSDGFTTLNTISTIGSFLLGASMLPFLYNVYKSYLLRRDRHLRRPVGPRQLPGVGDVLPAAAAQLHLDPAHPLRAAGVRVPLPAPAERLEREAGHSKRHTPDAAHKLGSVLVGGDGPRQRANDTDPAADRPTRRLRS